MNLISRSSIRYETHTFRSEGTESNHTVIFFSFNSNSTHAKCPLNVHTLTKKNVQIPSFVTSCYPGQHCITQNAPAAAALLEYGARVNLVIGDGLTPLHEAVGAGSTAVAEMLVRAGANVSVRTLDALLAASFVSFSCLTRSLIY